METNDYENYDYDYIMTLATISPGLMIKIWHQSLISQKSNTLIIGNDEKYLNIEGHAYEPLS